MPVHDWTRVTAGTFHHFHQAWITALSDALPEMPLFLPPDRYINVPLETTYQAAWRGVPQRWKRVIVGQER